MWQLEQYESHQKKGLAAVEAKDWRLARFHLLKASEYLLKAALKSGPDFQQLRQQQASKLMGLARQCEERLVAQREGRATASEGLGGGGGAATGGAGGSADKHLTDFRPMPPGDLRMSDVVGLDEVKRQVRLKVIYPLEHPELIRRYRNSTGGGILLYGPPGTGKTMIARAIASEIEAPFYNVKPSDILAHLVGVAERNIARLFETLRGAGRAVVFFDELDALLPTRDSGGDSNIMARLVPQFLQEMQGVADSTKAAAMNADGKPNFLLMLGATNTPWALDPAVLRPGRFDELIYIPLPDKAARRLILEKYSADRPLADDLDFGRLGEITEGFSGADLRDLCDDAAEAVLERAIADQTVIPVTMADYEAAIAAARPSVRTEHLKRFEEFIAAR